MRMLNCKMLLIYVIFVFIAVASAVVPSERQVDSKYSYDY